MCQKKNHKFVNLKNKIKLLSPITHRNSHIEIIFEKSGQLTKEICIVVKLIAKERKSIVLKLPSKDVHLIFKKY